MTLVAYLALTKESISKFSKRAGVSDSSIKRIKRSGHADSRTVATKIVIATGGDVTMGELFPEIKIPPKAKRAAKKSAA